MRNKSQTYVEVPRKVSGTEPQLPPELAGKAGSVYLTVVVATDGKVQDVKVIGGDSQFVDPVVGAVKQFVYEPQLVWKAYGHHNRSQLSLWAKAIVGVGCVK